MIYAIDDDKLYIRQYEQIFGSHGAGFRYVTNGDQLDVSELLSTAIVLLDLILPGKDGLDILGVLARNRYPGTVVLVSSVDPAALQELAPVLAGLDIRIGGYLRKPFLATDLKTLVARIEKGSSVPPYGKVWTKALSSSLEHQRSLIDYKPFFQLDKSDIAYYDARFSLSINGHALDEPEYKDLLRYSGLYAQHMELVARTITEDLGQIPGQGHWRIAYMLDPDLLGTSTAFGSLCAGLSHMINSGISVRLGIRDFEYFHHCQELSGPLGLLKDMGAALFIDRANLSFRILPKRRIGLIDEYRIHGEHLANILGARMLIDGTHASEQRIGSASAALLTAVAPPQSLSAAQLQHFGFTIASRL